jgi:hypothetical protein
MASGESMELKERLVVAEETAKLADGSWEVRFVDAFVYQLEKGKPDSAFLGADYRLFCFFDVDLLKD